MIHELSPESDASELLRTISSRVAGEGESDTHETKTLAPVPGANDPVSGQVSLSLVNALLPGADSSASFAQNKSDQVVSFPTSAVVPRLSDQASSSSRLGILCLSQMVLCNSFLKQLLSHIHRALHRSFSVTQHGCTGLSFLMGHSPVVFLQAFETLASVKQDLKQQKQLVKFYTDQFITAAAIKPQRYHARFLSARFRKF